VRKPGRDVDWVDYPVRPDRPIDRTIAQLRRWNEDHDYLGDAVPSFTMEFGPEHFAALLGAELRFQSYSGWIVPCIDDWHRAPIRFQRDGYYWQQTINFLQQLRSACGEQLVINAPVLSAGLDALSAMRGSEKLLLDLLDDPETVQHALVDIRQAYHEVVEALAEELSWESCGSSNWLGLYHPRRTNVIQSDISCMLSGEQFRQFEMENLRQQASHYDAVAYHLDGPGAVHHIGDICAVPGISVIQYVPVPSESPDQIEKVYQQIEARGMAVFRAGDPATIRRIWDASMTKRLIAQVWCASREEAEACYASF